MIFYLRYFNCVKPYQWWNSATTCYHDEASAEHLASGNAALGPLLLLPPTHSRSAQLRRSPGRSFSLGPFVSRGLSDFTCSVHRTRLLAAPVTAACLPLLLFSFDFSALSPLHSTLSPAACYYGIFPVWPPPRALLCCFFRSRSRSRVGDCRSLSHSHSWLRARNNNSNNGGGRESSRSARISYSHRDIKMSSAISRASSLTYAPGSRWDECGRIRNRGRSRCCPSAATVTLTVIAAANR